MQMRCRLSGKCVCLRNVGARTLGKKYITAYMENVCDGAVEVYHTISFVPSLLLFCFFNVYA